MYYGERLNSISHLVGAVFALIAFGSLLTVSIQIGEPVVIIGFSVFGFSMILLYSMSALYHSFNSPKLKRIFKVLDHISIYLLIAGTYTPFMLVSMRNVNGWLILGIVWALAVIGIFSEIFLSGRAIKVGQIIIYLCMGWACSLDIGNIKAALPGMGFFWLLTGGVNWLDHAHGIWHFFVLVGSISHFISVVGYVR
jgi:hemolysin III